MASGSSSKRPLSENEDGPDTAIEARAESSTVQATSAPTIKKKRRAAASPGIVYISRLPPGMTPQKVRHLMGRWGEIGKVYAQRPDAPAGYDPSNNNNRKKKEKHRAANFTEAWVEFLDKSVAKTIANMLNAQVIGGRPGDRWRDDIWTMKYLSGFKWEMLGEQVAYERQAHQSRLRAEIAKSKTEQGEYLKNVELARVLDKRRAKKGGELSTHKEGDAKDSTDNKGRDKTYKQRQVVDKASGGLKGSGMDSVLASVFG